MAFRNVFRYRRRSLITALAIALGVTFTIMVDAMLFGAEVESARNIRDFETGDAKVFAPGYFAERSFLPMDFLLEAEERTAIEKGLAGCRVAPRAVFPAAMYFGEASFEVAGSASVKVIAVDPVREAGVFRTPRMVDSGRWLEPGDYGIVIGAWLAEDIGAKVGYTVSLECKGRGGFWQTLDTEVTGIVLTDDPYVNRNTVYIDLSRADALLDLAGAVTEYAVRLPDSDRRQAERTSRALGSLAGRLPGGKAELYSWDRIEADAVQLTKTKSGGSKVYLLFMFIIAAVGVSNTMLMAVMERRSEIGTLRALGYTSFRIRYLFLAEGFGIGLIGTAAGTLAGCLVTAYMVSRGIDFSFMLREIDAGYRLTGIMRSAWHPEGIVKTVSGALVISSAVAWFPSGRILASEVSEILRS